MNRKKKGKKRKREIIIRKIRQREKYRRNFTLNKRRRFHWRWTVVNDIPYSRFEIIPRILTISSQRELPHESSSERLFAWRSRNSRRFSAFVGHTWPKGNNNVANEHEEPVGDSTREFQPRLRCYQSIVRWKSQQKMSEAL